MSNAQDSNSHIQTASLKGSGVSFFPVELQQTDECISKISVNNSVKKPPSFKRDCCHTEDLQEEVSYFIFSNSTGQHESNVSPEAVVYRLEGELSCLTRRVQEAERTTQKAMLRIDTLIHKLPQNTQKQTAISGQLPLSSKRNGLISYKSSAKLNERIQALKKERRELLSARTAIFTKRPTNENSRPLQALEIQLSINSKQLTSLEERLRRWFRANENS